MTRAISLTNRERVMVGSVLRELRVAKSITPASRYERAGSAISAARALDLVLVLVTEANEKLIGQLLASIPTMAAEAKLRGLIEQAEREGKLEAYGTDAWIAVMSGFNYQTIRSRMVKIRAKV